VETAAVQDAKKQTAARRDALAQARGVDDIWAVKGRPAR